jgi:uncharacterized protein (TIGR03067 family)
MRPVIFLALSLATCGYPDDAVKADLKALQGKWSVVSGVDRGKPVPAKELEGLEFEISGSTMTIRQGKNESKSEFNIDPSKKPKQLRPEKPKGDDETMIAIYEIKGDEFKFAFRKGVGKGSDPPKGFELKDGDDVQIFVLKRKK